MVGPPTNASSDDRRPTILGRYALFDEIASGGMATVHLGRLVGHVGFSRTVAIKRLHPNYAADPELSSMFIDEARLASRIQHPNVVPTIDVVTTENEAFLVMEYVAGESLDRLLKAAREAGQEVPLPIAATLLTGVLHGLHAAHEAKSERREPLGIVHRDVSPQNVLVGTDGVVRVLDFGVAKAALRVQAARQDEMKGKLAYMSPEQLNGDETDRRSDVFSAGVVLWEVLTGRPLFAGGDAGSIFARVLTEDIPSPRTVAAGLPEAVERVVMRALDRDVEARYQTARDFAIDLEEAVPLASPSAVGDWLEFVCGDQIARRAELVRQIEKIPTEPDPPPRRPSTVPPPDDADAEPSFSGPRLRRAPSMRGVRGAPAPARPVADAEPAIPSVAPAPADSRRLVALALVACIAGGVLAFAIFRPRVTVFTHGPSMTEGAGGSGMSGLARGQHGSTVGVADLSAAPDGGSPASAGQPGAVEPSGR